MSGAFAEAGRPEIGEVFGQAAGIAGLALGAALKVRKTAPATRWSAQIDVISYATGQHLRTPANSGEGVGRHSPTRMRRSSPEDHGDPYHTMRKFITIFLSQS